MADKKITDLTALTSIASGDILYVVDISDTTDSSSGSSRKITFANLTSGLASSSHTHTLSSITDITASAAELNVLDGIPGTLTATELGYVDGVTSAIQTQLDAKAPLASPTFTGTVTLPVGLTGVLRADSGVVSVDSDVTDIVAAASTSAAGKIEIATAAETTAGTDATRAVSPDGLAGSDYGVRVVGIQVVASGTDMATGDGKAFFRIPSVMNGWDLVAVAAKVYTAGTTSTCTIQIRNITQAADMLSTKISIDSAELDSSTAATPAVIDTNNDDVATGDGIAIDVDTVHTTAAKGLFVEMQFKLP